MPMSDYEKLIWEEIKEMRSDIKAIREYIEEEISTVKTEVSSVKTAQEVSKVKIGTIVSFLSILFTAATNILLRKIL